ncbi:hypothetical protein CJ030_MR3G001299 [Morella rubra]|uniref:Endonuclease/exonuclease/phosphatase domain-containing protein n=1 Tax=Morella rubra TaxID=262757 RepID=A0A6A1W678_9ROSI|nr:hypothetical protein CJ030_MR3G001299 [Morella rubra]
MLSIVYGPPYWHQKAAFWQKLQQTGEQFLGPWVLFGDFNAVAHSSDKTGGRLLPFSSSNGLFQLSLSHGLVDVDFTGNPFTWTNGKDGQHAIFERLDKGVANGPWRLLFPRAMVCHLPRYASDHAPILLDTEGGSQASPKPFRFEPFWAKDPRSFKVVAETWQVSCLGSPGFVLCDKIKRTRQAFRVWNRLEFGMIQHKIQHCERLLDQLQSNPVLLPNGDRVNNLQVALIELQRQEEELWRSKSRVSWLATLDLNTRFFHLSTIIRRRHNCIEALQTEQGSWIYGRQAIGDHFIGYFQHLFSASPEVIWMSWKIWYRVWSLQRTTVCSVLFQMLWRFIQLFIN